MIQFNDIKLHDLVFLDSEGIVPGWFLVTGVSQKVGFFTATQLGYDIRPVMVPSDRMDIVRKHYSATAVPGAIEALEAYERATQLAEVSNESPEALNEWIEASYDATTEVLTALRAIRGEESA